MSKDKVCTYCGVKATTTKTVETVFYNGDKRVVLDSYVLGYCADHAYLKTREYNR